MSTWVVISSQVFFAAVSTSESWHELGLHAVSNARRIEYNIELLSQAERYAGVGIAAVLWISAHIAGYVGRQPCLHS